MHCHCPHSYTVILSLKHWERAYHTISQGYQVAWKLQPPLSLPFLQARIGAIVCSHHFWPCCLQTTKKYLGNCSLLNHSHYRELRIPYFLINYSQTAERRAKRFSSSIQFYSLFPSLLKPSNAVPWPLALNCYGALLTIPPRGQFDLDTFSILCTRHTLFYLLPSF